MQNHRTEFVKLSILSVCLVLPLSKSLAETPNKFYNERQRGWFWHESVPTEEEEELKKSPPPVMQEPENIELTTAWLKERLPILLERAIDHTTPDNLANYAYAQRLMVDKGTRFSSKMMEFMATETLLDESVRRPTSAIELNAFGEDLRNVRKVAISEVKEKSQGLFFFYSSQCSFCLKMIPVLNEFKRTHNIDILAISLDGGVIEGMDDYQIVDDSSYEVASKFNVTLTPTIHLMINKDTSQLVVEGLKPLNELEERLLLASRKSGIISQELYASTRSVKEINVFKNENGNLVANKKLLEDDPNYLANLLRMQLSDQQPAGTKLFIRQADE